MEKGEYRLTGDILNNVRDIDGFPLGEDEDIIALSDPPYYTACPNPYIEDFIKENGNPYDPKNDYHREPFAADVSEGKKDPIYNSHSYHTKVPHKAIMRYILHYTDYESIINIAEKLPIEVLQEDPTLLMYYNNALARRL